MDDACTTLAQRFRESAAAPIELGGQLVHLNFDLPPIAHAPLVIRLAAPGSRPQALCLFTEDGLLEVEGERSRGLSLWTDTAPDEVAVLPRPKRGRTMTVRLWNAWRDDRGVMHAGTGNCGMVVERTQGLLRLRCSAGPGPVDFGDLVAEVRGAEVGAEPDAGSNEGSG